MLEYPKDLFKVQAEPLPRPNRAKSFGSRWRKPASLPSNPGKMMMNEVLAASCVPGLVEINETDVLQSSNVHHIGSCLRKR